MRIQSIISVNTTCLFMIFCLFMKVSQFTCASIDASEDELRKIDNKELIQMKLARLNDLMNQYENKGEQINFKGSLSDDDTENEANYDQNAMPDDENSMEYNLPAKKSAAFLRFGKSPAYLRFGRGQAYLRFGKRGQAYLRFGKSNPAYLRFGR